MNLRRIAAWFLTGRASRMISRVSTWLLFRDWLRRPLVGAVDRRIDATKAEDVPRPWRRIERERRLLARAILYTVDRLIARRALAPRVLRVITELWGRALCIPAAEHPVRRRFREEFGRDSPWFITIAPGHSCNLRCTGCYASAGESSAHLPWPLLDRLVAEAKARWGIALIVFSGGEPLAYRSEGRDLLDIVEKHDDLLYLMFTNGTLIDEGTAARLARLGNLTPAISVEGLCERTDVQRGPGVFDRAVEAMALLRQAGVPFGISATATRDNCEEILSDRFLDLFFTQQGAFYGFLFHYMPIGRDPALERMPTPAQRVAFWRRSWEVVREKQIFLFDFWNHGPIAGGCLSAGRPGGYIYVDWNGKIMPCVFVPYAVASVQEIFARGGTLDEVWTTPLFKAIQAWQRDYGQGQAPSRAGNWLRPCPIRDHYGCFHTWIDHCRPEPQDDAARRVQNDEEYYRQMVAYGRGVGELTRALWEEEYLGGIGAHAGGEIETRDR